ncbi:glycosyltransferase family 39 protein [Streptomyces sp. P1-3]|uniref:glycosyltransferase family 39 protein n=1 Tax=Streptomyces sp. P1-3 TaxID=3421658 RepID=UPI003D363464
MVHPPLAAKVAAAVVIRPGSPVTARPTRPRIGRVTAALVPAGLTLVIGLWGIRRQGSMGRDESTTYQVTHRTLPEIWHMLGNIDAVHGLHYLLMHALFSLWDGGLLALRLPSVLAMAAAAAAVGLIGHRLAGPRAGLLAGLVFPMIPAIQQFAQEGRSYALVCALVAWSSYQLLRALDRPHPRTWTGYAVLACLAGLLHEFAVIAVLAHGVTLLLSRVPAAVRWSWGLAATCAVVPLIPLVIISQQQSAQVSWLVPPTGSEITAFAVWALVGTVCAAVPAPAPGPVRLWTLALPLLVLPSTLLMLAALADRPLYTHRYIIYSYTGLALLIGTALDRALRCAVRRGRVATVLAVAVCVAIVASQVPTWARIRTAAVHLDDPAGAARAVREMAAPGDGVVFMPSGRRESMLSHPRDFEGLRDLALAQDPASSGTLQGIEVPASRVPARLLAADRIIAVYDPNYRVKDDVPEGEAKRAVLERHYDVCETRKAHGIVIRLYARPGSC